MILQMRLCLLTTNLYPQQTKVCDPLGFEVEFNLFPLAHMLVKIMLVIVVMLQLCFLAEVHKHSKEKDNQIRPKNTGKHKQKYKTKRFKLFLVQFMHYGWMEIHSIIFCSLWGYNFKWYQLLWWYEEQPRVIWWYPGLQGRMAFWSSQNTLVRSNTFFLSKTSHKHHPHPMSYFRGSGSNVLINFESS